MADVAGKHKKGREDKTLREAKEWQGRGTQVADQQGHETEHAHAERALKVQDGAHPPNVRESDSNNSHISAQALFLASQNLKSSK